AEDDLVDVARLNTRARDRFLDGHGAERCGFRVGERAAEGSDCGPACGYDDCFGHERSSRARANRDAPLNTLRAALDAGLYVLLDPADDVLRAGPRGENLSDTEALELFDVVVGNDAAAEHRHVAYTLRAQKLDDLREERHVRPREDRKADRVYVFLHRR